MLQSKLVNVREDLTPYPHKSIFKPEVELDDKGNIINLRAIGSCYRYPPNNPKWQKTEPFVFEATLVPEGSYRTRSTTGMLFSIPDMTEKVAINIRGLDQFLQKLADPKSPLTCSGGGFKGLWVMKKTSGYVHIYPWQE